MFLESTLYPSHVREILFLGSCLIHDFPSTCERDGKGGSCRVKSTLHSPFHPLYRGENAGHGARCIADASMLSIFTSAHGDSLSAMRQFL